RPDRRHPRMTEPNADLKPPRATADRLSPVLSRAEIAVCRRWIAEHSRSFYLSSLLLPRRVRHGAWALYAFCRRADDAVDEHDDGAKRIERLRQRLDAVYAHERTESEIDRAFAVVVHRYAIPRALPE